MVASGITARVQASHPGENEQRRHHRDKRDGRYDRRVPEAVGWDVTLQHRCRHAEDYPDRGGDRKRAEECPCRGCDRRHRQNDIVVGAEGACPVDRSEQDPNQARHEAGHDPRDPDHTIAVHAVQLDQTPALDRSPHLQAQVRVAEQYGQQDQHDRGDGDRREVDAVDRRPPQRKVDGVRIKERQDGRGGVQILWPEDHRQEARDPHQQRQAADHLRDRVRVRDVPEQQPVEGPAHHRSHHYDRDQECLESRPVVNLGQIREHIAGRERLRPEREVEDPGRLVSEDQADRNEREGTAEWDANKREAEELLHSGARRSGRPSP